MNLIKLIKINNKYIFIIFFFNFFKIKRLDKNKKIKNILIKTVENAIEKYNEEKMKTITRSTIIMNKNQIYDFKYNCYQNPLLLKKQELKKEIQN